MPKDGESTQSWAVRIGLCTEAEWSTYSMAEKSVALHLKQAIISGEIKG